MKKLLPQIALVFLLLLPSLGRGQENRITGRVVDAITKEPIPFASIGLRASDTGALTNESGYFRLLAPDKFNSDSLVVLALGYNRATVFVGQEKPAELSIAMRPRPPGSITVCRVGPCGVVPKIRLATNDGVIAGAPGTQYAFFIENDKRRQTRHLRSVSFYVGENGLPMAPFRVRIYQTDGKRHMPTADLLTERVVLMPAQSGQWLTSDISRYNVVVPKDGYFVALEFVNPANQLPPPQPDSYLPSGQVMRPSFDFKKSSLWCHSTEKGWALVPESSGSRRYNAMVKLEVAAVE